MFDQIFVWEMRITSLQNYAEAVNLISLWHIPQQLQNLSLLKQFEFSDDLSVFTLLCRRLDVRRIA